VKDTTVSGVRYASDSSRRFFGQAVPQSLTEDELISFWADFAKSGLTLRVPIGMSERLRTMVGVMAVELGEALQVVRRS
jgi:hypothetical protein